MGEASEMSPIGQERKEERDQKQEVGGERPMLKRVRNLLCFENVFVYTQLYSMEKSMKLPA